MPYKLIKPVIDMKVRDLCQKPYHGHPKGCPNYNHKKGCPPNSIMANLKWIIPICLSTIQFPLLIQDRTLGVE